MVPTEIQIKGLLLLPEKEAEATAVLFAKAISEASKVLTSKAKLLELIITQLLSDKKIN